MEGTASVASTEAVVVEAEAPQQEERDVGDDRATGAPSATEELGSCAGVVDVSGATTAVLTLPPQRAVRDDAVSAVACLDDARVPAETSDGREAEDAAAPAPAPPGKRQKLNRSQRLKQQAARDAAGWASRAEHEAAMQASWRLGRRAHVEKREADGYRLMMLRDDVDSQAAL